MGSSMARRSAILAAALIFFAGLAGLQAAPADPSGGTGGDPLAGTMTVRVVAAGTTDPINGAFVMVGPSEGAPFAGNVGVTNGSGEIVFSDPALTGPVAVTAGAAGLGYVTIFDVGVDEVVLPLDAVAPAPTARLGDQFLGIEVNNGVLCLGDGNFDVGLVLPALAPNEALSPSGVLDLFVPASEEPLSTPLGLFPVPSTLYVPEQCELLGTYTKEFYHLRAPVGQRTIFGLTARGTTTTFLDLLNLPELNLQAILGLLSELSFSEMDVLRDFDVNGNTNDADLLADLPLSTNLTLQVSNAQPLTSVVAAGFGRITTPQGTEEIIVTGIDGFDPDELGSASTLGVSTRQSIGELADLIPGALVMQLRDGDVPSDGATLALVRSGFTPPATLAFDSYYDVVDITSMDEASYAWTNVVSATSPATRHLNRTRVVLETPAPNPDQPGTELTVRSIYWTMYSPGSSEALVRPTLPVSAPTVLPDPGTTPEQDIYVLTHEVLFLGDDPDGFDYAGFALDDATDFGTHASTNEEPLPCDTAAEIGNLQVGKGLTPDRVVLTWDPSLDICHNTFTVRGYEVYSGDDPIPGAAPGDWPSDPGFAQITDDDLDGDLSNATFTHVAPGGLVLYVVVDRGLSGNEGPSGHYE